MVEFADDLLLPTHLHYLVTSGLSKALKPAHLDYGLFSLLLPTHLSKRGLATASHPQTQLSRVYTVYTFISHCINARGNIFLCMVLYKRITFYNKMA